MTNIFRIDSSDINRLSDIQLTQLLHLLLQSEAFRFGIAQRAAEVALNITVGDGGEDGRISWDNGPEQTDYLPNRLTMFQVKATEMGPQAYANEIMTSATSSSPAVLKRRVEAVLDAGGAYIFFTTQELNNSQKEDRITKVREKLHEQGKGYANTCEISIYDAAKISAWVNQFIPAIVAVQNWVGTPVERGLKTFTQWGEHEDLSRLPFASVASRQAILDTLSTSIENPRSCFRITGLSGLGKTRTAFELFKQNDPLQSLVVYVDATYTPGISALVTDWVTLGLRAIVVVDNCEYRLHENLVREVRRTNSQITLLTLDYNFESVGSQTACFKLEPMPNEELLILLSPVYSNQLPDLDRIVAFAQGFPQMAVLLAEARLSEEPRIGELTEDELANKLLWNHNREENQEKLKILQACSLFDFFGVENEAEDQLAFVAGIAEVTIDQAFECIQEYSARGLIDRRGRFGQVVPKPLAIRLAGQWWSRSREQRKLWLVNAIPEGMIEGFCNQVEKMDFHTDVKNLTEDLCGPQGPFGQAKVILSNRGSRLFRAFVNVNPESTSEALYAALTNMSHDQIYKIETDTRRNLVWGLERLCYHSHIFPQSAWCLLLLASAENEDWSNNATGIFSQLYRIWLSGTASAPDSRFELLNRALELNNPNIDMVLLKALGQAIDTHGGSRVIGAEYQGTKAPLEEWRPELWREIFDYWQHAVNLLLVLLARGEQQKEEALVLLGHSIRGFVARGRIKMLDAAIRQAVRMNGRYWPSALEAIKDALEYDSDGLKKEAIDALTGWLDLLKPDESDASEQLKILVISPPWEHGKDQHGHYFDVASENAKALATKMAGKAEELLPLLDMLLQGEQRQSYAFGFQLAQELDDPGFLISSALNRVAAINQPNLSFVLGFYNGLSERCDKQWQESINLLLDDRRLIHLYPNFVCTGKIEKPHLDRVLELINAGHISQSSPTIFSYGGVINNLAADVISDFCVALSGIGDGGAWAALRIIHMYCFADRSRIDGIRDIVRHLVSNVKINKDQDGAPVDAHRWHDLAQKLLTLRDEEFATSLTKQIISACEYGLNHGDISHYIKPLLVKIIHEYGEIIWPIIGSAIANSEGMERYWLQQILDRENSFSNQTPSVLAVVPVENIMAWCEENPDIGPAFVAACVNIFDIVDDNQRPSQLFVSLLERFGGDPRVVSGLRANMGTRGWSGSLVPYLKSDKEALCPLLQHDSSNVKIWVKNQIAYIDKQIAEESVRDEEMDAGLH